MKNFRRLCLIILVLAVTHTLPVIAQQTDPVKKANQANKKKADQQSVEDDAAKFLVKASDARMMGIKEGQLAVEKGTTAAIKDYGKLMVKDQSTMLKKIKTLAASRNITLPSDISEDKQDGFKDLSEKTGKDFDKKFCKMMEIDHKRDIRQFKSASDYNDNGIKAFAKEELPLIKNHLEKIQALKEK